eukprot:Skav235807  [mRNA]  locus=scaffold1267:283686:285407:- [translate_table: standard]
MHHGTVHIADAVADCRLARDHSMVSQNRKLARGQSETSNASRASSPTSLSTTDASHAEASHAEASQASPREATPQAAQAAQAADSNRRVVPRAQTWQSTVPVQRMNFVRAQTWGHELHSVPEGGSLPSAALVFLLPIASWHRQQGALCHSVMSRAEKRNSMEQRLASQTLDPRGFASILQNTESLYYSTFWRTSTPHFGENGTHDWHWLRTAQVPDQAAGAFQRATNVPEHRP